MIIKKLIVFSIVLTISSICTTGLLAAGILVQQDVCQSAACKCVAIAEEKGAGAPPMLGGHSISGDLNANVDVAASSGYTNGKVDGACPAFGCNCDTKCSFHYDITITISGYGSVPGSTVDGIGWKWRQHDGAFDISGGLPFVLSKSVDFELGCGAHDVSKKLKLAVSYNVSGAEDEVTNEVEFIFECLDCPNANS